MTTLASGWRRTDLGSLGLYTNGRGFKKSEWRDHGRPIIRIQNLTGSSEAFNHFEGDAEDRHIAHPGDLLVSWAATLGAYIWHGPEAVVNQHIFKVDSNIDKNFHKYLLDFKLEELMRQAHGSGMVHITRGKFESLPVSVPQSLDEQRRIVDVLEGHLSRLAAGARGLGESVERLRLLKVSSLVRNVRSDEKSATDSLMFGDQALSLAPGWAASCVAESAELVEYGTSSKTHEAQSVGDVPVLRMGNVKDGRLVWESLKYLASDHPGLQKLMLRPGDLLFNRTNSAEHVGKAAVFEGERELATFASYLIRARFRPAVDPRWANMVINSLYGRAYVTSVTSQQVGQANVNGTKLKAFPLPVPPLVEQLARIRRHSDTVERTDRLFTEIQTAEQRIQNLRRSLLAAAFSGRLTGRTSDLDVVEELSVSAV